MRVASSRSRTATETWSTARMAMAWPANRWLWGLPFLIRRTGHFARVDEEPAVRRQVPVEDVRVDLEGLVHDDAGAREAEAAVVDGGPRHAGDGAPGRAIELAVDLLLVDGVGVLAAGCEDAQPVGVAARVADAVVLQHAGVEHDDQ